MGSIGCIFAEMANGRPLFAGTSESDQLDRIFRALGTPDESIFPGISELPEFKPDFESYAPPDEGVAHLIPSLADDLLAMELVSKMLCYDPAARISAFDAMQHPYFSEIHSSAGGEAAEE